MHKNRKKFKLQEYQTILKAREKGFKLLLQNKETLEPLLYSPKQPNIWTESGRKNKLQQLRSKIKPVLKTDRWKFVTLTYNSVKHSNKWVYENHKKHINLFFKELRKFSPELKYFYVVELTDNLTPHFHVLMTDLLSKRKIESTWTKVSGERISCVRNVKSKAILSYVTKYLTKQFGTDEQPDSKLSACWENISRLFIFSRNFTEKKIKEAKETLYELIAYINNLSDTIHEHTKRLSAESLSVYSLQVLETLLNDPPDYWRNSKPVYNLY